MHRRGGILSGWNNHVACSARAAFYDRAIDRGRVVVAPVSSRANIADVDAGWSELRKRKVRRRAWIWRGRACKDRHRATQECCRGATAHRESATQRRFRERLFAGGSFRPGFGYCFRAQPNAEPLRSEQMVKTHPPY